MSSQPPPGYGPPGYGPPGYGPPGYGPPGYGPPGYGPPGYGPPGYGGFRPAPNHPQATTVLVLGILGIVVCGLVGPFAWGMGNTVVREIDASQGQWGGRTEANVGRILGVVASVLLLVWLMFVVGMFVFGGFFFTGFMHR